MITGENKIKNQGKVKTGFQNSVFFITGCSPVSCGLALKLGGGNNATNWGK